MLPALSTVAGLSATKAVAEWDATAESRGRGHVDEATRAYAALIQYTLGRFSTTLDADLALLRQREDLEPDLLPPRMLLAVQFRVIQKRGLHSSLHQLGSWAAL